MYHSITRISTSTAFHTLNEKGLWKHSTYIIILYTVAFILYNFAIIRYPIKNYFLLSLLLIGLLRQILLHKMYGIKESENLWVMLSIIDYIISLIFNILLKLYIVGIFCSRNYNSSCFNDNAIKCVMKLFYMSAFYFFSFLLFYYAEKKGLQESQSITIEWYPYAVYAIPNYIVVAIIYLKISFKIICTASYTFTVIFK